MDASNQFSRQRALLPRREARAPQPQDGLGPQGLQLSSRTVPTSLRFRTTSTSASAAITERCDPLPRRGAYDWPIPRTCAPTLKLRRTSSGTSPKWTGPRVASTAEGDHPVTAHDVVFMLDLLTSDQVAGAAPLPPTSTSRDYEALDDYTFQIKFKKPKYMQKVMVLGLTPAEVPVRLRRGRRGLRARGHRQAL